LTLYTLSNLLQDAPLAIKLDKALLFQIIAVIGKVYYAQILARLFGLTRVAGLYSTV
jgi:hypothetical protein